MMTHKKTGVRIEYSTGGKNQWFADLYPPKDAVPEGEEDESFVTFAADNEAKVKGFAKLYIDMMVDEDNAEKMTAQMKKARGGDSKAREEVAKAAEDSIEMFDSAEPNDSPSILVYRALTRITAVIPLLLAMRDGPEKKRAESAISRLDEVIGLLGELDACHAEEFEGDEDEDEDEFEDDGEDDK
jgi:hypothetical protein